MVVSLSRRGNVEPFHAMDILAEANRLKAQGVPVISMAVGQPSDPAPVGVREAAVNALKIGRIGYTCLLYTSDAADDPVVTAMRFGATSIP